MQVSKAKRERDDGEVDRLFDATVRRMLNAPPKPHAEKAKSLNRSRAVEQERHKPDERRKHQIYTLQNHPSSQWVAVSGPA